MFYTFIAFGAIFAFVLAAAQLIGPDAGPKNRVLALLLFTVGLVLANYAWHIHSGKNIWPHGTRLLTPFLFAFGPLLYAYLTLLSRPEDGLTSSYFPHLLIVPLVALYLTPYYLSSYEYKLILILQSDPEIVARDTRIYGWVSDILAPFWTIPYLVYFVWKNRFLWRRENRANASVRVVRFFVYLTASIPLFNLGGVALGAGEEPVIVARLTGVLLALAIVILFLASNRYAVFFQNLGDEVGRARYAVSRIGGLDVTELIASLKHLMEVERVYCDEDMDLTKTAELLEIKPHQLTELLNVHTGKNFNTYINEYRVGEARRLLVEEKDRSIISIAHAVGFNSQSSFYSVFVNLTGRSPGKFRRLKEREPG